MAGYWTRTPDTSLPMLNLSAGPTTTSRPRPSARERQTAMVWGWQLSCNQGWGLPQMVGPPDCCSELVLHILMEHRNTSNCLPRKPLTGT